MRGSTIFGTGITDIPTIPAELKRPKFDGNTVIECELPATSGCEWLAATAPQLKSEPLAEPIPLLGRLEIASDNCLCLFAAER